MSHDPLGQKIAHTLTVVAQEAEVRDRWADLDMDNVKAARGQHSRFPWTPLAAALLSFGAVVALVGGALLIMRGGTQNPALPNVSTTPGVSATIAATTSTTSAPTTTSSSPETTTASPPVVDAGDAPRWPDGAPGRYLVISADRVDAWLNGSLEETLMEPGVDRALIVGNAVVFDTFSTSDIYVYPPPDDTVVGSPGGAGGLIFGHFQETQIRLQGTAGTGDQVELIVEEIDEFNFGDELTMSDYIVPRRLMLYDPRSGDRRQLLDIANRNPALPINATNGSVTQVSEGGGVVAVAFATLNQSWIEFYTLDGEPFSWSLPYTWQVAEVPSLVVALAPDGTTIVVGVGSRVEMWNRNGTLVNEWLIAGDGEAITYMDWDGQHIAGAIGPAAGGSDMASFVIDVPSGRTAFDEAAQRIVLDRSAAEQ